jgi:hypothetical protein
LFVLDADANALRIQVCAPKPLPQVFRVDGGCHEGMLLPIDDHPGDSRVLVPALLLASLSSVASLGPCAKAKPIG